MRKVVDPLAPLVRVASVRTAFVVGANGSGDFGAILTHAHFVTLKKD
jgi:hypothetical protein